MASFGVEVDHVFVSASVGAPEARQLANAMLELIWVENEAEARSEAEPARRLHLWERWSGRDGSACPFGVCLRPSEGRSSLLRNRCSSSASTASDAASV